MDTDTELVENIKACRTCGIHYVTPTKHQLKHLFQSALEHSEINLIRLELSQWNVEVAENDGYPQYVCQSCIHKFEQVFALRASCINAQNEFRKFYAVPNGNIPAVQVKNELPDPDVEQPICDFIYVDDLSDTEFDGVTPFNFPHIPIKEEVIEAATIPTEASGQPTDIVEAASRVVMPTEQPSSHIIIEENSQNDSEAISQSPLDQMECHLCEHFSLSQQEHKQHLQHFHDIQDYECHICGKDFKNSTSTRFKFHLKWHTLKRHLKCTVCGLVCNSKDDLMNHKRTSHRKLNCKICRKAILAKKMKTHLRQHAQRPQYPCEYCAEVFDTEDQRENHIWGIHANEDNNFESNAMPNFQTSCIQNEVLHHESQEDILYKFVCAHCEQRFIEQIDLETHVNEEHRVKSHLLSIGTPTFIEDDRLNEVANAIRNEQNVHGQANLDVFEHYNGESVEVNNDLSLNNSAPPILQDFMLPSSSTDLLTRSENVETDESIETVSNDSFDEDDDSRETAVVANSNFESYAGTDLNTFACAKCSKTFVTIGQLRQHHEQHLAEQKQQETKNQSKSMFKCNLCGKLFDLKFILNRHVKKHKIAPI